MRSTRAKAMALLSTLLLVMAFTTSAFAATSASLGGISTEAAVVAQSGECGEVKKVYESEHKSSVHDGVSSVVFDVITRAQDYSTSTSATDSSASARAYLTIRYRVDGAGVLLTGVSGSWQRLDPTVSVGSSGTLRYGCQAVGVTNQNVTRSVSSGFSIGTGFRTYVPNHSTSSVGANLSVPLTHGSSKWTLYVQNNVCP